MKDRMLLAISFVCVIIQMTVMPFVSFWDIIPSLSLIVLLSFTACLYQMQSLRMAIYMGILTDILIGRGLGMTTFIYMIISYLFSSIEEKIFKDNLITPLIIIVSASLIEFVFFNFIAYMAMGYRLELIDVFKRFSLYALLNSALGIPVYTFVLRKFVGYGIR